MALPVIDITSKTGEMIGIAIAPMNDAATFIRLLQQRVGGALHVEQR